MIPGPDFLHEAAGGLLSWLGHHIALVLGFWGFFWTIGAIKKAAGFTGKTLVGVAAFFFAAGWLWKRRRDVGTGIVVVAVTVTICGWLIALWVSPGLRWSLILPLTPVVLAFLFFPGDVLWPGQPGGWLWEKTGNSSLGEALREWVESHQIHAQLVEELGSDAGVTRPRKVDGDWVAGAAAVGDPNRIDAHAVGGRANKVTDVRQVGVKPGDKLGSATITMSPEPPPPQLSPWQRFEQIGPQRWPGPMSTDLNAPMRVLFDPWGRPLLFPVPGMTGNNLLLTGPTGAGKSATLHVMMADLAFRHDLAIIYLDPHAVEGELWEDRCSLVARGIPEVIRTINHLPGLMEGRGARMKGRSWNVRNDGPRVLLVIDEYAAIPTKMKDGVARWLAEGRKFGGGAILCLQRAERDFIPLHQRDNCRVRVACGAESDESSRMTLGNAAPLATQIPESLKGGSIIRVERSYRPARSYLLTPPGPIGPDDDPIEIAAPKIARATSALKIPLGDL